MKQWVVCGGGMRGIAAAALLRNSGHSVVLIERQPELGGLLCSPEWGGLYVDKGCHLLDFAHSRSGKLYEAILGTDMHPIHRTYASINSGFRSNDIALPDMSHFAEDLRRRAIDELKRAVADDAVAGSKASLTDFFLRHFGSTAGSYAAASARKMTGIEPDLLDHDAFGSLPLLQRIRYGPDIEMLELKKDSRIDERAAAASVAPPRQNDAGFPHRNQYPSKMGMRGFCIAARQYLESIGVELRLGASIAGINRKANRVTIDLDDGSAVQTERVYWSGPAASYFATVGEQDPATSQGIPASLLIYAFRVPPAAVTDITYIHDYRPETNVFRFSTAGLYGRQTGADGLTYILAEVPTNRSLPHWKNPMAIVGQVWAEAVGAGLVDGDDTYRDVRVEALPAAFVLPKLGGAELRARRAELLSELGPEIVFPREGTFGKASIVDAVSADLEL
ncbi:MAG: NAD(P)-binding protein [Rhizobiaceae bacterium]